MILHQCLWKSYSSRINSLTLTWSKMCLHRVQIIRVAIHLQFLFRVNTAELCCTDWEPQLCSDKPQSIFIPCFCCLQDKNTNRSYSHRWAEKQNLLKGKGIGHIQTWIQTTLRMRTASMDAGGTYRTRAWLQYLKEPRLGLELQCTWSSSGKCYGVVWCAMEREASPHGVEWVCTLPGVWWRCAEPSAMLNQHWG